MELHVDELNSSSAILAAGINQYEEQIGKAQKDTERFALRRQAINYIEGFPIPSNKEDLIDFIISLGESRNSGIGIYRRQYQSKWKEAMKKARLLFPDDPQVVAITKGLSPYKWDNLSKSNKDFLIYIAICIIVLIIAALFV